MAPSTFPRARYLAPANSVNALTPAQKFVAVRASLLHSRLNAQASQLHADTGFSRGKGSLFGRLIGRLIGRHLLSIVAIHAPAANDRRNGTRKREQRCSLALISE